MNKHIEVFSAECPCCVEAIALVKSVAAPSDEITVVDMNVADGYRRAQEIGVAKVPAVAVDGRLASCCSGTGVEVETLRAMGVGA